MERVNKSPLCDIHINYILREQSNKMKNGTWLDSFITQPPITAIALKTKVKAYPSLVGGWDNDCVVWRKEGVRWRDVMETRAKLLQQTKGAQLTVAEFSANLPMKALAIGLLGCDGVLGVNGICHCLSTVVNG